MIVTVTKLEILEGHNHSFVPQVHMECFILEKNLECRSKQT
jgi:hypothetical protein